MNKSDTCRRREGFVTIVTNYTDGAIMSLYLQNLMNKPMIAS